MTRRQGQGARGDAPGARRQGHPPHCQGAAGALAHPDPGLPHGSGPWAEDPRGRLFLAALRCDRITAPCVIDGPINGASFRAYVEQFLVPTLSRGAVVILDNLGSHRGQAIRRAIRAAGAKLFFLPRYSPDLNPIEQVFAKLKTLLRKAEPRTTENTWRQIGSLLDRFTAEEGANYLANAGYAST
jgi:transposase